MQIFLRDKFQIQYNVHIRWETGAPNSHWTFSTVSAVIHFRITAFKTSSTYGSCPGTKLSIIGMTAAKLLACLLSVSFPNRIIGGQAERVCDPAQRRHRHGRRHHNPRPAAPETSFWNAASENRFIAVQTTLARFLPPMKHGGSWYWKREPVIFPLFFEIFPSIWDGSRRAMESGRPMTRPASDRQ